MGNFGIKISKEGKNVGSEAIIDQIFWSKYQSLPLIEKASLSVEITSGSCTGTETYTHNLGFFPLVLGTVTDPDGDRMLLPYYVAAIVGKDGCVCGSIQAQSFDMNIKLNTIDIVYSVKCIEPQIGECCDDFGTYVIDLSLFMFELGS